MNKQGQFIVFRDDSKQWNFRVLDGNGDDIIVPAGDKDKAKTYKRIEALRKMCCGTPTVSEVKIQITRKRKAKQPELAV